MIIAQMANKLGDKPLVKNMIRGNKPMFRYGGILLKVRHGKALTGNTGQGENWWVSWSLDIDRQWKTF